MKCVCKKKGCSVLNKLTQTFSTEEKNFFSITSKLFQLKKKYFSTEKDFCFFTKPMTVSMFNKV